MTEEVKQQEAPAPKPKQYLLMVDEVTMTILGRILPTLLFVEVEGMNMKDNETHSLLVNPKAKPVEEEPKV
jgi:hypothetical protein